MRALGYPSRGTLTKWVREAFPEARRALVGSVGQRRYPESLKQAGVMELCTRQESAQTVADKLGVCRPTLYNWKSQLLGREAPASMKHTDQSPQEREREELERQVEILRREVRQLRLEQDLLNKANELLKKGLGVDLQLLSNREKTLLIDALKEHYRLPELLAQLGLARSSYFYHRSRTAVGDKYLVVRQSLTEIFESNHRCYGYRRLQASLAREQGPISEKVVQRLMKQENLVVAKPKRRRFASYLGEISLAPDNIINRDFQAATPNEKWLTACVASGQVELELVLVVPTLQRILRRIAQLLDGGPDALAQLDVELNGSDSIFVGIHELPPASPSFRPHPQVPFSGSLLGGNQHQCVRLRCKLVVANPAKTMASSISAHWLSVGTGATSLPRSGGCPPGVVALQDTV